MVDAAAARAATAGSAAPGSPSSKTIGLGRAKAQSTRATSAMEKLAHPPPSLPPPLPGGEKAADPED
jgi:hypothetical protein